LVKNKGSGGYLWLLNKVSPGSYIQIDRTVDLANKKCSCREWQVTGKPCKHALAWILSNRGVQIDDFVHEYYSVARFKVAYADRIEPLPDRSEWPVVDLRYKVYPPLLGRGAGRPKVQRIRGCLEQKANKKKVKCRRCKGFGHFAKTCKLAEIGEDGEMCPPRSKAAKRYAMFPFSAVNILLYIFYVH
jgi:hypothetical protein